MQRGSVKCCLLALPSWWLHPPLYRAARQCQVLLACATWSGGCIPRGTETLQMLRGSVKFCCLRCLPGGCFLHDTDTLLKRFSSSIREAELSCRVNQTFQIFHTTGAERARCLKNKFDRSLARSCSFLVITDHLLTCKCNRFHVNKQTNQVKRITCALHAWAWPWARQVSVAP